MKYAKIMFRASVAAVTALTLSALLSCSAKPLELEAFGENSYAAPSILENHDGSLTLRVLSYNTKSADYGKKLDKLAQEIKDSNAHIVLLQEIDYRVARSDKKEIIKLLAEKTGMNYMYYPAINLGRGLYGLAIMSCFEIIDNETLELPTEEEEDRILAKASVKVNDELINLFDTHLSYESKELRNLQFETIKERLRQTQGTFILGGDFNIDSFDEFIVFGGLKKANSAEEPKVTFYGDDTRDDFFACIDNIIVSDNIEIVNAWVENTGVSDHKLLLADVRVVPKRN